MFSGTLEYAIRFPVIGKYLGRLAIALAVLTLPPLAAAVLDGAAAVALRYALVLAVLLGIGLPLARRPAPVPIQGNEALVIAALAFILGAFVMAFPLMSLGLGWLDAVFESISAITTTGLSTLASVEDKPRYFLFARAWQQWYGGLGIVVLSVALLAGYDPAARQLLDPQARLENFSSALLGLLLYHAQGVWGLDLVGHAWLVATSAQTTTGFTSLPVSGIDATAKLVLILSMLVGGSVGSTAGDIKVWRLLLLLRLAQLMLHRTAMPSHAVVELRLGGRVIETDELTRDLLLMLLFAMIVLFSWLPFLWFGHDPLNALFEIVSALATTGLSTGVASPYLHPLLKGILCADMVLGRLEIVAVLVLFAPWTWFGRRMRA